MRTLVTSVMLIALLAGCAARGSDPPTAARSQLAPSGTLRVGVAFAPNPSPALAVLDAGMQPHGVPVTLAEELGKKAGVPASVKTVRNSGELTDLLAAGQVDLGFLPVDETRMKRVDFGPAYFIVESTFLVRPGLNITTIAELDKPGVRVIGISNTATLRGAAKALKTNTIAPVPTVQEAAEMIRRGQADAFAYIRDGLTPIAASLPGSVVLKETFLRSNVAAAIPKGRPAALGFVDRFTEDAKRSGLIKRAFVDAGLLDLEVAPPLLTQ